METLETRYEGDKELLEMYKRKLLIPSWSGDVDEVEAQYIANCINSNKMLWVTWRKAHGPKLRKKVTANIIQKMCIELAEREYAGGNPIETDPVAK